MAGLEEEAANPPDRLRIAEHWERCVSVGVLSDAYIDFFPLENA